MSEIFIFVALLCLMAITGFSALWANDLLASIIMFSAFSFFAVLTYLVMGAPDVAFTEAVIGVVSTTFFIIALNHIKRESSK
ncbi:MAG: Na(+)/H(+) antiporter subunit B [Peptococcia bacterium]|jgi:energy-converting hydrogenase B subunit D